MSNPERHGFFQISRVVKKMTPFLPALDVYHKCFDPSTRNCTCYLKFRLGVDPSNGELAKCVSLGRRPKLLGWHQEWCDFPHVDLQNYTAEYDDEMCGGS